MMKLVKCLLVAGLIASSFTLGAQISADELEFESKSIQTPYKAKNKNYAYIRSKRGTGGVNKNDKADSVATLAINEIVLVYTEIDASDKASRAEANKERWENLGKTYPEYFDYSPVLVNVCQCNPNGDTVAFKKVQGFYVYFEGDETEVAEEPVVEEKAPEKVAEKKPEEKKKEDKKAEQPREEKKDNNAAVGVAITGAATGAATSEKKKEKEEKKAEEPEPEPKKESRKKKEEVAKEETKQEAEEAEAPVAKAPVKKKAGFTKPRRAKDPKACRPPCYDGGDEGLNTFFAENMPLSKKQKRKFKSATSTARLMLNFDGSIKKVMVAGPNEDLNKMVQDAVGRMNLWDPAVKNGVTVKSDVKITLKYDKETKAMKPSEVIITPRPAPKCKCMSDAEMFGSN